MTQILNTELVQSPGFTIMKRSYAQQSQGVNGSTVAELRTNDTAIGAMPQVSPDDDCLFNPSLPKCAPIEGKCPSGFLMNENEQCFPNKPCPSGFTKLDEDETGTCYPVSHLPTPSLTARSNVSSSTVT
jgi:hypothetical protein